VHGVFFAALLALASPIAELRPQFGGTALAAHGRCEVEPNGGLSRARRNRPPQHIYSVAPH